ncbi:four helix bundle protein [Spirosoma sp. KUDC1026]|uniref:four helix bundle protein n=1 Tax=Spirosoma sp. KUDC1026 TaxID=2745947 RepID=UPI00159BDD7F|nr:four helix bundle protein [Spirosoma sp. KUDC1026]QKZ11623.1 four helix bundle protein [Spirosoma sp. KUDC1026]
MDAHNFRELKVWQVARALVKDIYVLTTRFPEDERFGLTSQVRRASISIPSNIAEGSGRSDRDFVRFLSISLSSAYEVETQLLLAYDLGFLEQEKLDPVILKVQEIQRMLFGLQRKLSRGFLSIFFLPFPLWTKLYFQTFSI